MTVPAAAGDCGREVAESGCNNPSPPALVAARWWLVELPVWPSSVTLRTPEPVRWCPGRCDFELERECDLECVLLACRLDVSRTAEDSVGTSSFA